MQSFVTLPKSSAFAIVNARTPPELAPELGVAAGHGRTTECDFLVDGGKLTLLPAGKAKSLPGDMPKVDLRGGIVLPRFVEVHTHLDKGHIWWRIQNDNGTVHGARTAASRDREENWSTEDVRARMNFALKCAYAHGTGAIRTHIDSYDNQTAISFGVFAETRIDWKDRIKLQAVALFPTEVAVTDEAQFLRIADIVEKNGCIMGGVTAPGGRMAKTVDIELDRLFQAASARGLDVDLHVDETTDASVRSIERIADAVLRNKFKGKVLCGHCCSLSTMPEEDMLRIAGKLGEAGIAVVSLPMVNMYLQDRTEGRTPRFRGVAPLHELAQAGVDVMISSDNTRDPYHAYGDLDMLEVFREGARILHLDHSARPWMCQLGAAQATHMGLPENGILKTGGPADLVLTQARSFEELLSRPQSDRAIVVNGVQSFATVPDYRELDHLYVPKATAAVA
jgi:cytosine deaminase